MEIANANCPDCNRPLTISRMACPTCSFVMQGSFALSPLSSLNLDEQAFVIAFIRHHGSLKKMEGIFNISYPTVKNRLNSIAASLDRSFQGPSPNLYVLEQLARGELTVDEALEKLG